MKQTIIALAGPDRCGKTNIIAELSKRLCIFSFKASQEHANFLKSPERFVCNLQYADARMVDMLKQCNYSIIMDRCWACEWVYAQALGRRTDFETLKRVDSLFAELGTIVVIVQRSSYVGIVDDLDPKRLNSVKLQEIHDLYDQFAEWTACKVMKLNVDDEDLNREVNEIISFVNTKGNAYYE